METGRSDRARRIASFTLAASTLLPPAIVFPLLGVAVDRRVAEVPLVLALLSLPVVGLLAFVLMVLGAAGWLAVARFVVARDTAAGFFQVPGLGVFSSVSRRLFELAYGSEQGL